MSYFAPARLSLLAFPCARWLLLMLLLPAPLTLLAQQKPAVRGTVTTSTGLAVELATVTLHRATDSMAVKTEFSDAQGNYRLEATGGKYRLSAAQVGFQRYWSPVFELTPAGLTWSVRLVASQSTALKEVTVTARKPLYEHLADRTIVNVADNPLSAGSTSFEVLSRAPGVTLDGNENISLRGRKGVLLLIDGKRNPLTGLELADFLRGLPAEQIQSIELITNPRAQYDAQGTAGIVAINLKKDQRLGTNGSANASYGRGQYGKFTSGLALNHRRKRFNAYGNYALTERRGFVLLDLNRRYAATPLLPPAVSLIVNEQLSLLRSHSAKAGIDFTPGPRTVLGVSATGLAAKNINTVDNETQLFGTAGELTDHYTSQADQRFDRPNGSLNLNLRHSFADSATAAAITADADFARYRTSRLLALTTFYQEPLRPTDLLEGDQESDLSINALKADFSQPLPHRARMDAGVKFTKVISDNRVLFVRTSQGTSALDAAISNRFRYEENVNAAYATMSGMAAKTSIQAGLRLEQTNTLAETEGTDSRRRNYLQLFPSFSAQREIGKQHTLALSAARRIDRPSYVQINPLRVYLDATSYRSGNPGLVAQTSYNVELTHTFRKKFNTAFSFAQTYQPIVLVVQPSDDGGRLVVNRDVNLSRQQYYSLTLTAPLEPVKWWNLYGTGTAYYSYFRGDLAGTALNRGRPAFQFSVNNSFTLPLGWSAELNGNFQSREIWGFELARPRGQVGAGFQKSLWNKQGTLRLNVTDLFYTMPVKSTSNFINFSETFRSAQDTRVVTAALAYRFGNSKVTAARKRTVGAEEELRRAAGQ